MEMTKALKAKLKKQIHRLCEKQFRRAFQQGFLACQDGNTNYQHVNDWRHEGTNDGYRKRTNVFSGAKDYEDRLIGECAMGDMEELTRLLT